MAEYAFALAGSLADEVDAALMLWKEPNYQAAAYGMFIEVCYGPTPFDGVDVGLMGVTITAFFAGVYAIVLTRHPAYRGRQWSGWWSGVFYAGAVVQGGSIGISLVMMLLGALLAVSEPEALLVMPILFAPNLILGTFALPAWMKLRLEAAV
jgi:hypothetical protein